MPLMISAFVAFVVVQQTAEDYLKQVEDKYLKAKTVSMSMKVTAERKQGDDVKKADWTIEAKFKEGNRVKLLVNGTNAKNYEVVCDGKKTSHGETGHAHSHDAPADYAEGLRLLQVRAGCLVSLGSVEDVSAAKNLNPIEATFAAEEKVGDRQAKVVEFKVKHSDGRGDIILRQKLFVDAETHAILKREVRDDFGSTVTEIHSDVKFDGEIADDAFNVKQ